MELNLRPPSSGWAFSPWSPLTIHHRAKLSRDTAVRSGAVPPRRMAMSMGWRRTSSPVLAGMMSLVVLVVCLLVSPSRAAAADPAPVVAPEGKSSAGTEGKTGEKVWLDVARSHLRAEPGTDSDSVVIVSAGQELEVVATQDDWMKVATSTGKVGWLSRRAVTATPPTPVVVKSLEKKLAGLQSENEQLTTEMRRLADSRQELELQTSKLRTEVAVFQAQTEELKSWRIWMWALIGLVVLLVGWVLGFITGTLRRQADDRRYDALKKDAAARKL